MKKKLFIVKLILAMFLIIFLNHRLKVKFGLATYIDYDYNTIQKKDPLAVLKKFLELFFSNLSFSGPENENFNQINLDIYSLPKIDNPKSEPVKISPFNAKEYQFLTDITTNISQPTDYLDLTKTQSISIVNNLIYFSQTCSGINSQFCLVSLPGRDKTGKICYLKDAGCGPTTVSMIISNLTGTVIPPNEIVKFYTPDQLGCHGSTFEDNVNILRKFNIKVGKQRLFWFKDNSNRGKPIDFIASELRKFNKEGKTFFTLATFRNKEGKEYNHFFWILSIDDQNNVFSLDPSHGNKSVPFNLTKLYPYPLYITAITVSN